MTTIDERVEQLLADAPPLTDAQAEAAARILATVEQPDHATQPLVDEPPRARSA